MLCEISVQNMALIEDVRVELNPGFSAWTGETGAGKSLLLDALGLLLGERGSAEMIRNQMNELRVTGRFELKRPELKAQIETILDQPLGNNELILSRKLQKSGSSKAYFDEIPISVTTLKKIGTILVDIHGQQENYSLLQPAYQLKILDLFGNLREPRQLVAQKYRQLKALRQEFQELSAAQESRQREIALLTFEQEELNTIQPKVDELNQLYQERDRWSHVQNLQEFAQSVTDSLYDTEGSAIEQIGRLLKDAHHWQAIDPNLEELSTHLNHLNSEIRDIVHWARNYGEKLESNPERLEAIEKRIDILRKLEMKYKKPLNEIIAYQSSLAERLSLLEQKENNLDELRRNIQKEFSELKQLAQSLSAARFAVAERLASTAQGHLTDLGMPFAKIEANLKTIPAENDPFTAAISEDGCDQFELMLCPNPGEPSMPLRKIASGGELSRTMLALKTVLATHDQISTLVFDEIDANVGGRLGDILGQKLAKLGQTHQVICVTHLPQVAAYAKNHFSIRKRLKSKRTSTTIHPLIEDSDRIEELANMLRGESRSETTRQEAREMLENARKIAEKSTKQISKRE